MEATYWWPGSPPRTYPLSSTASKNLLAHHRFSNTPRFGEAVLKGPVYTKVIRARDWLLSILEFSLVESVPAPRVRVILHEGSFVPSNLYPYPDHNHHQQPMPTHAIQKLCNMCYLRTPSLGWIGQIKGCSLSLASARSASWLAYSLHPRSLTPIWRWMQGCTKSMPTQNPWAWVGMGMGMGTQCRAMFHTKCRQICYFLVLFLL
jgi:hypothetical protein